MRCTLNYSEYNSKWYSQSQEDRFVFFWYVINKKNDSTDFKNSFSLKLIQFTFITKLLRPDEILEKALILVDLVAVIKKRKLTVVCIKFQPITLK